MTRCTLTHDNGARPFRVCRDRERFVLHRDGDGNGFGDGDGDGDMTAAKPKANKNKNKTRMVVRPRRYTRAWHRPRDSSALFRLPRKDHYMFVGDRIIVFKTRGDPIVDFRSPIGNSDVPYPYAVGTENTYLLVENTYVKTPSSSSSRTTSSGWRRGPPISRAGGRSRPRTW